MYWCFCVFFLFLFSSLCFLTSMKRHTTFKWSVFLDGSLYTGDASDYDSNCSCKLCGADRNKSSFHCVGWVEPLGEWNAYKTRPFDFKVFSEDVLREKHWLPEHSSKCNTRGDGEGGRRNVAAKIKEWGVRGDSNWEGPISLGYSSISYYATSQTAENTRTN